MRSLGRFLVLAFVTFSATTLPAAVVLNEMRIDQPGGDTDEFVELFSDTGMSLDGITFVILQDNGTIDGAIDLTGNSVLAGGFFLIAETDPLPTSGAVPNLVTSLALENGENSAYLLVDNFTSTVGTDLDADDDGVFDAALPWGSILDGVALIDDEADILNGGTEDINYGPVLGVPVIGPDGTFYPGVVFASVDGGGIDSIGDFGDLSLDTPGFTNVVPEPSALMVLSIVGVMGVVRRRRS